MLLGVTKAVRQSLDMESVSQRRGLLQRIDPRFVLVLFLSLIVITVLLQNPLSMLAIIVFANAMAVASAVPLGWYLKRVWLFVPLFTLVVLIPSMTSLIIPGQSVGPVLDVGGAHIYFTREGLEYAATFTMRVGGAVSLSILMMATIGWSRLMRAMGQLRFPPSFVVIIDMTYRYIHLLLDSVADMFLARKSRMVGKPTVKETRSIGSSVVASLVSKSYHMSEQVYMAMRSRGYDGRPRMSAEFREGSADHAFAALVTLFAASVLVFDRLAATAALEAIKIGVGGWI